MKGGIQLPDDVVQKSMIRVSKYKLATVYFSPGLCFQGTEEDFLREGHAYRFVQIDGSKRLVLEGNRP